jgi:hypothetical protein
MELPRLAAKQKRYKDILHFTEHEVMDPAIKPKLLRTLASYRLALAQCWSQQAITDADLTALGSIERDLEELHNDARLRTSLK